MNGRCYWINLPTTAITVAADIIELTPADDKPIEVIAICLGQTTDFGDAQEEIIPLVWVRGHTTSGSGGAGVSATPCNPSDVAAGFTAEGMNTTQATVGTTVNLARHHWNVRAPIERPYTPDEVIEASQANTTLVLRMLATPADSISIGGSVLVRERG